MESSINNSAQGTLRLLYVQCCGGPENVSLGSLTAESTSNAGLGCQALATPSTGLQPMTGCGSNPKTGLFLGNPGFLWQRSLWLKTSRIAIAILNFP